MLSVYYAEDKTIIRFSFVDGMATDVKRCLAWTIEHGARYYTIDSGESSPLANRTPVAKETLKFSPESFLEKFIPLAEDIDPTVREFIAKTLTS